MSTPPGDGPPADPPAAPGAVVPGTHAPLAAGELVVLVDRRDRRYLRTLEAGGRFHTHAGYLEHDELIGASEGSAHRTSEGMELTVLRPTREDFVLETERGAQVVYPKDQAAIVAAADIRPGCHVVEAGAGSGALTLALLAAVGPSGRVVSYERRSDHLAVARRNVARFLGAEPDNWEVHERDVADDLADLLADRVVLDLTDPWSLVAPVAAPRAPGGLVLADTPTVPQVMRLTERLREDGRFGEVTTTETLERGWHVDGLSVRPDHRMVAHTAFLTTARRVLPEDGGGPRRRPRRPREGPRIQWVDGPILGDGESRPTSRDD